MISISDPGTRRPRIRKTAGLRGVVSLRFHDAEPVPGVNLPDHVVLMTSADAESIWSFVLRWHAEVGTIVVHCEQGMSRSPAVAIGIALTLDLDAANILTDSQPNQFVLELVRTVGAGVVPGWTAQGAG